MENFIDNLPGFPDNIRPSSSGGYWVAMSAVRPNPGFSMLDFLSQRPWIKKLIFKVKEWKKHSEIVCIQKHSVPSEVSVIKLCWLLVKFDQNSMQWEQEAAGWSKLSDQLPVFLLPIPTALQSGCSDEVRSSLQLGGRSAWRRRLHPQLPRPQRSGGSLCQRGPRAWRQSVCGLLPLTLHRQTGPEQGLTD